MAMRITPADVGLLVLRVYAGSSMLLMHGWGKLLSFPQKSATFPDPLGIGSSPASMGLAVFAEVLCAALIVAGAFTRLAAVPLAATMIVAGFVVHAADPWVKKELAFTYLAIFLCLIGTGPGALSVDVRVRGKRA